MLLKGTLPQQCQGNFFSTGSSKGTFLLNPQWHLVPSLHSSSTGMERVQQVHLQGLGMLCLQGHPGPRFWPFLIISSPTRPDRDDNLAGTAAWQCNSTTFGFWLPAELRWGNLYKFTDCAGEATASYPWEAEPSSAESVVFLTQQGWDIWAAASHPKTQLTPPWLVNPHAALKRHFGRDGEESGCQNIVQPSARHTLL